MEQLVVSYSSQIHLELPPREGVAALPYAEIPNPLGEYFAEAAVRADTAVRPYAEDLDRLAALKTSIQAQKNDACFASSFRCYQSVFQQLMLLDYQIGLDFAFGTDS